MADLGSSWIGLWECKKRPESFWQICKGLRCQGQPPALSTKLGVPNCPTWCSSQVSKSSVVSSTATGSLTVVVSLPSGVQKLTHLCGIVSSPSGMWKLTHLCGIVSLPSDMQKLTRLLEGFGYYQGNGPSSVGNAFASGRGLGTLPNFPPTVGNGQYVDSWNAFFASCQAASCSSCHFDYGYVIFLWARYSIYLNHFVRWQQSPSSFGRLPAKQPHQMGEG